MKIARLQNLNQKSFGPINSNLVEYQFDDNNLDSIFFHKN